MLINVRDGKSNLVSVWILRTNVLFPVKKQKGWEKLTIETEKLKIVYPHAVVCTLS